MRETLVVFRRELKGYFFSPIAYVFGALFLGIYLFFMGKACLNQGQQASMQVFFAGLPFVFLFFLPGLTMRLWAEERKTGTLELLMTFPVRLSQLIAGKFFATLAFLALVLLLTFGLPLTMALYGSLDWPPVFGGYLAALLLAGSFVALGMFWSSLTRDQLVALLAAMGSLLALWGLGKPEFLEWVAGGDLTQPTLPTWLLRVLAGISPYGYFDSIAKGVLDSRDLVYYVCFCGFWLYANALVLQARRVKG